MRLVLRDEYGNAVPLDDPSAPDPPALSVLAALPDEGGQLAPCEELAVRMQQEVQGGQLVLSGIQVLGCQDAQGSKQGERAKCVCVCVCVSVCGSGAMVVCG